MPPCNKEERQPEDVDYSPKKREEEVAAPCKTVNTGQQKGDEKSSIRLELGTYNAAKLPLAALIFSFVWSLGTTQAWKRDPRTYGLSLGNETVCIFFCCFYILFSLTWGPKIMENRNPIKLKKTMMAYNVVQIVLCSYMFYEFGFTGWFAKSSLTCQPIDTSNSPEALRIVNVVHLYFLSKILDCTDTVFFFLNKKWSNITVLHVFHHSIMCLNAWTGIFYIPVCHLNLTILLNSAVHVMMYSYYFLAALGPALQPYLWWKKYLTSIQLAQFIFLFFHTVQIFFNGCTEVPRSLAVLSCIYAICFIALFAEFYVKEYSRKKQRPKTTVDTLKTVPKESAESTNVVTGIPPISSTLLDTRHGLRARALMMAE